jgi:hypothetical protein
MSLITQNESTAVDASKSYRIKKGIEKFIVDVKLDATDDGNLVTHDATTDPHSGITACTVKLQGSETNEDNKNGLVTAPTIMENAGADSDLDIGAFHYKIDGTTYTKAAATITTIATTTITGTKWGGFNIYINAAGTLSTQVPSATQAYASVALANTALDAIEAKPGTIMIAKVIIDTDATNWVANTDDFGETPDLTGVSFNIVGPSFIDLATHVFTDEELRVQRAQFVVTDAPCGFVRTYLSTLTGTGKVTTRVSPVGGY